jgi:hypothetical protein
MRIFVLALAVAFALGGCKSEEEQLADAVKDMFGNGAMAKSLQKMSRNITDRLLGDSMSAEQREAIAKQAMATAGSMLKRMVERREGIGKQAADTAGSMLKRMFSERLGDSASARGGLGAATAPKPALTPAEEAALISRLDLGGRGDVFPAGLTGVRLGMTAAQLRASRPGARFSPSANIASEDGPADGPISRVSYHFEKDALRASFVTLRVGTVSDALLAKATAKWGRPRADAIAKHMEDFYKKRGGAMRQWQVGSARVKLEKNSYSPEVQIYIAAKH